MTEGVPIFGGKNKGLRDLQRVEFTLDVVCEAIDSVTLADETIEEIDIPSWHKSIISNINNAGNALSCLRRQLIDLREEKERALKIKANRS
jgi:hypothetical protein